MKVPGVFSLVRAAHVDLDRRLAKRYPRLRVLQIPAIVSFSLIASALAGLHGYVTPGTPSDIHNAFVTMTMWFLLSCAAATAWIRFQWRERTSFPPGCRTGLAWSPLSNALCIGALFLPSFVHVSANHYAVRKMMPLGEVLSWHEKVDREGGPRNRSYSRAVELPLVRRDPHAFRGTDCDPHKTPAQCVAEGYEFSVRFHVNMQLRQEWCSPRLSPRVREYTESIWGSEKLRRYCATDSDDQQKAIQGYVQNMMQLYAAHDVLLDADHITYVRVARLILAICFFAFMVAIFGAVSTNPIWGALTVAVGALGISISLMDGLHIGVENGLDPLRLHSILPRVLLVALPLAATIGVALVRRRGPATDLLAMMSVLSGLLIILIWWTLMPDEFFLQGFYELTTPQIWSGGFLLGSLLLSPVTAAIFDRYRSLPRAA